MSKEAASPAPTHPDTAGAMDVPDIPYQAIIEQALAGIYVLQDEVFVYANATFAGIAGYTPAEMIGRHVSEFVQPDFIDSVLQSYRRRIAGNPASERFISRALHKDGRLILLEIHGSRVMHRGRYAVCGVGVEVTERVRNEEALEQSREQLRQLSAYANTKLEDQRRVLSRDIHDELGGMLTALKMDATRVMRRLDGAELQGMMRGVIGLTQQTIDAVKRIAEELRPSALDHLDLPLAITRDLEAFTLRSGVPHTLDAAKASTLRLSPRRATAVYRIFHEALTNVARHAAATHVDIALSADTERFLLVLRDDGVGFDDAPAAASGAPQRSLGLLHMRERAREIGGDVCIETAPGRGTTLVLTAPLL